VLYPNQDGIIPLCPTISTTIIMKLHVLLVFCLTPFKRPSLAFAETLPTLDLLQDVSEDGRDVVNLLPTGVQQISIDDDRSLQTNTCGRTTQWEDIVVVELPLSLLQCFQEISGAGIISDTTWTSLLKNAEICALVKELEASYKKNLRMDARSEPEARRILYALRPICSQSNRRICSKSEQKSRLFYPRGRNENHIHM